MIVFAVFRWFIKVRESITMLFSCQSNRNDTGSPIFISRNGENNSDCR